MPELVGRDRELGQLDDLWHAVQGGRGRIAIVTAEAGGGKTALLQAWTEQRASGADVLWGECQDGEGAPPFWPWLAILGVGESAGTLAAASSSEAERFAAFRTASEALTARSEPAVVVLDDLHWADGASLRFLEFLAPLVRRSKLLLIVASRPVPAPAVQATIGTLLRNGAEHLPLAALGPGEIAAVLAAHGQPAEARVGSITGGNPLLVQEYARHLDSGGSLATAPLSLTAMLHAELRRLSEGAQRAAEVASVRDGVLRPDLLRRASGATPEAFDEIEAAGLFVQGEGGPRWRHDALREAVRGGLTGARRAACEAALAEACRALGLMAEMAVHGCRAGAAWEPAVAHAAAVAEARSWEGQYVLEMAAEYATLARSVRQLVPLEPGERLALDVFEGTLFARLQRGDEARAILREAAQRARAAGDAAALSEIALSFDIGQEHGNARVDETVALLRDALDLLPAGEHAVRARLLSRLAWQVLAAGDVAPRERYSAEALREARMSEDAGALATALMARSWALARPEDFEELQLAVGEAFVAARDSGDVELQLGALFHHVLVSLASGRVAAARTAVARFDELTERYPLPYHRWYAHLWKGALALVDDDPSAAQAAVDDLDPEATTQLSLARLNRDTVQGEIWVAAGGDLALRGLELMFDAVERELGIGWVFRPRIAAMAEGPEAGRAALVRSMEIAAGLAVDEDWFAIHSELAAAAVACGATEESRTLYDALSPYPDRWVVIANGASCRGPVLSFLSILARVAGMPAEAEAHAHAANEALTRAGVRGLRHWLALRPLSTERRPARPGGLTARESEVLALVARGHSNQEIADALVLSVRTVQRHVENAYGRLGLHNRADAALAAVNLGLVSPGDVRERAG